MTTWIEPPQWLALEPLLDTALDGTPAERTALLGQLRASDPALADRLDGLLRLADDGRGPPLLDRPAAEVFEALLGDDVAVVARAFAEAMPGRYEILGQVGVGGSATVYAAHDCRHDREVAIKILHPAFAAAVGSERFLAEIRTTARLQHPHLLPLLDSGDVAGQLFYVMPCVRGESLRARLDRERVLPIEDALRLTREIAGALDHAHRHGVIHRDVKPENVLLHEGQALVADWGIALAASAAEGGARSAGAHAGTVRYMSPEQARGDPALDARSDVFSLGCVLYEMLVGAPPFRGATAAELLADAMARRPDPPSAVRDTVSPALDAAVLRALARLPADRHSSAARFAAALARIEAEHDAPAVGRTSGGPARRRVAVVAAAAAGVAVLAAAALLAGDRPLARVFGRGSAADATVSRLLVTFPAGQAIAAARAPRFAFTRDGGALVYVGVGPSGRQLWIKRRDQLSGVAIPGTDGAEQPTFSPDGRRVAFLTRGANTVAVRVVPVEGGQAITLATSERVAPGERSTAGFRGVGVAWGVDGHVYLDGEDGRGLRRVRASGGPVERYAVADSLVGLAWWPQPLDDGRVLVTLARWNEVADSFRVAIADPATRSYRVLVAGTFARVAPPGDLVYVTARGDLMGAPFDAARGVLTGPPVKIGEGLDLTERGGADLAVSATGTLAYVPGDGGQGTQPVWVARDGGETPVHPGSRAWRPTPEFGVAISPNGAQVAYGEIAGPARRQVSVHALPAGPTHRLTVDGPGSRPFWLDARTLAFHSRRAGRGRLDLWKQPADGSAPAVLLLAAGMPIEEVAWSPRSPLAALRVTTPGGGSDLMTARLGVDRALRPLLVTPFAERTPTLSPNGRLLAYTSNESGQQEVYVRTFPDATAARWQVSDGGGTAPLWSRSGDELFFESAGMLVAVAVRRGAPVAFGARRSLFGIEDYLFSVSRAYDQAPDGRFLMFRRTSRPTAELALVDRFPILLREAGTGETSAR